MEMYMHDIVLAFAEYASQLFHEAKYRCTKWAVQDIRTQFPSNRRQVADGPRLAADIHLPFFSRNGAKHVQQPQFDATAV